MLEIQEWIVTDGTQFWTVSRYLRFTGQELVGQTNSCSCYRARINWVPKPECDHIRGILDSEGFNSEFGTFRKGGTNFLYVKVSPIPRSLTRFVDDQLKDLHDTKEAITEIIRAFLRVRPLEQPEEKTGRASKW